jgi:uncharacterized protein YcnI
MRTVLLALAVLILTAAPAAAHVTLHSNDATQGGSDALVSIRVPNEEDKATTSQLEVDFPADTPLVGLLVQPTPGWQFQVTNTNLPKPIVTDDGTITQSVSKVVWTGGSIPVGGYQDFNIDVSSLPKAATVTAKAIQTYSNGDVVRWIDPPAAAGQPAPDHPAPTLTLTASTDSAASAAAPSVAPTTKDSDSNVLPIIALVAAGLALVGVAVKVIR